MDKDLSYYLSLPYRIETEELSAQDGGGFMMCMPELGRAVVLGDGDTLDEAFKMLKEVQREMLELWLKDGVEIPEPESINRYSGKIALRVSPTLHKKLAENAKRSHISVNQYIFQALEAYTSVGWLADHMRGISINARSYESFSDAAFASFDQPKKGPTQAEWLNVA
ncbi:toxin-antitoxin system HicB family antitoxin [Pyramidobacter piscolens]|uniref:toxin-antitoxin system HicB family antitoxin n=1 Tax=Pyramidobacter piscolens TaxID=638849 RepID=UPI003AB3DE4F